MVTIATTLVAWVVWWWADQMQTITGPIIISFVARLAVQPFLKFLLEPRARANISAHVKSSFIVLSACVLFAALAIAINSERFLQIALTVVSFFWGASLIWFGIFSPHSLDRKTSGFNAAPQHIGGINVIIGASCILSAFVSAALVNLGANAVWVAFMSIGQVIMLVLSRWVAVMWVLAQPDVPKPEG